MTDKNEQPANATLDFDAIYLDTNVLIELGWPEPSTLLANIFVIAQRLGIPVLLPEPVEYEAEQHWIRSVAVAISEISSSNNAYERATRAVGGASKIDFESLDDLTKRYREMAEHAKRELQLIPVALTTRSLSDFFDLASRYVLPFHSGTANKSGQGKGFQDAVILASVLEHINGHRLTGLLITRDAKFQEVSIESFMPTCKDCRLVFDNPQNAFEKLYDHFWDREVMKPWEEEKKNAEDAVATRIEDLTNFISARMELSMLLGAGTPIELRGIDKLTINYVQTPIPDPHEPNRKIKFAIAIGTKVKVLSTPVPSPWESLLSPLSTRQSQSGPVELDAAWFGGVEATADVVDRQFTNLEFTSLLTAEQLGAGTYWKAD